MLACRNNRIITILGSQELTFNRRNVDKVQFKVLGQSEGNPTVVLPVYFTGLNNKSQLEPKEISEESNVKDNLTVRTSERLLATPMKGYRNSEQNSKHGGCSRHK